MEEDQYEIDVLDAIATTKKYRESFEEDTEVVYFMTGYLVAKGHNFQLAATEAILNLDDIW